MSNGWSRKIFLCPDEPTEDDFRPDTERILDELRKSGIPDSEPVRFSLKALRSLYPLCPDAGWKFTVTLAYDGRGWEITHHCPLRSLRGYGKHHFGHAAGRYGKRTGNGPDGRI